MTTTALLCLIVCLTSSLFPPNTYGQPAPCTREHDPECCLTIVDGGQHNVCYWSNSTLVTFQQAVNVCSNFNAVPVLVKTQRVHDFLKEKHMIKGPGVWLGASDGICFDQNWRWYDHDLVEWGLWNEGQPNALIKGHNCMVAAQHLPGWEDRNCSDLYSFICQSDLGIHIGLAGCVDYENLVEGICIVLLIIILLTGIIVVSSHRKN